MKKIFIDEFIHVEINETEEVKVEEIKKSMIKHGYKGEPVAYCKNGLLTGSHRISAAKEIGDIEIKVEDLTEEVNIYCENNECTYNEIDFFNINDLEINELKEYLINTIL